MAKKVNNQYVSTLIRNEIRIINNNKYRDIRYKIVDIAKVCAEYDYVFGTDLVWDTVNNYWVEPIKSMDLFNTACQIAGNSMCCSPAIFKNLAYIIRDIGMFDNGNQFCMPSTKEIVEKVFK